MVTIERLFEPIMVGNLKLKNRIKLLAMAVTMNTDEGEGKGISDQILAFYEQRARGGVAMIGISCTASKLIDDPMLGIYHDRFIPGLKKLAEVIHGNGAKTYAQMGVGYCWAFGDGPVEMVSPSGISLTGKPGSPFRMGGPYEPTMPRALSMEEIESIVESYGEGARRAKEAGFDAVEIIPAVGYVLAQFISPLLNKRTDKYGGNLENRMRFTLDIVDSMKRKTHKDFPVTVRISGADLLEPSGYGLEDTKKMARMLEEAGVSEIDVMSGWHTANVAIITSHVPQGNWAYMAAGVKSAVKIPVAVGTQIQDVLVAEKILKDGMADMVYMARALIADPDLPNKARAGQLADIRPCINCCRCIEASDIPPVFCSVNPRMGREAEYFEEKPAAQKKNVLVVGGGPAGLEAARVSHIRGHTVTLYEQNSRLGGSLLLASVTNIRMEPFLKYLVRQVKKLPIKIKLNTEVTPDLVRNFKPDVLIVAVGGAAAPFNIPGANNNIVLRRSDLQSFFRGKPMGGGGLFMRVLSLFGAVFIRFYYSPSLTRKLLKFDFPFKKRVAIIGGSYAGIELGEVLSDNGKQVSIIEESKRAGYNIGPVHRWVFLKKLKEAKAKVITSAKVLDIVDSGVNVEIDQNKKLVEADTVINVKVLKNSDAANNFENTAKVIYMIGDGSEPALLLEAMKSGFLTGQQI